MAAATETIDHFTQTALNRLPASSVPATNARASNAASRTTEVL